MASHPSLRPGVETLTITDAAPGTHLRVETVDGDPVVTLLADHAGNAHVTFIPDEHAVLADSDALQAAIRGGHTLEPGEYRVVAGDPGGATEPWVSNLVRVMAVDDHPHPSLYDQTLAEGFGYLTVRDDVLLSAMVRFPDENLYGPGPWPTVVEYSGYGPSDPDAPQPGTLLATLFGFAVVGVNIRGTGCSGGIFDVFSPAQAADGFDIIETVARQDFVLGDRVGMIGLSYPGIAQLYVAATRPPHLAAIAPQSVIDDLWRQQWPGGTYNSGFTRVWLAQRDAQTKQGGMAWDQARIDAGDEVARANQAVRTQNLDFESFGRALENFRPSMSPRRTADQVSRIEVPVFLTGSWHDEQTGSRFALMLNDFTSSPHTVFTLFNGHHPDGYSAPMIGRWFEFLNFHVAQRVPRFHDLVRAVAPSQFAEHFGATHELEQDRFTEWADDFEQARARYLAEPSVRILFESGTVHEVPGAPGARYEITANSFPPAGCRARRWYLGPGATLGDEVPSEDGADRYLDDPDAGAESYALTDDFDAFIQPTVPIEWTHFADEHTAAYQSEPLTEPVAVMGQGHVDLWMRPGTTDTSVQASLTEVRPDGQQVRMQAGWHRPMHRMEDGERSGDLTVDYTFLPEHRQPLVPGEWVRFRLPFMPLAHVVRPGSALRLTLSTPGRDHPFWRFDNPVEPGAGHDIGWGGARPSALVLPVLDGVEHPLEYPAADAQRGQPARPARPIANTAI